MVVALGLGYGARGAWGEESGGADPLAAPPTAQQTKELLDSPGTTRLEETAETDLEAARELPHRDLNREDALELADAVFASELESPAGIFSELEPQKFLSDNAAVVPSGALPEPAGQEIAEGPGNANPIQGAVLLESSLPLRTEDSEGGKEPVDLSLVPSEGELQPRNPLTDVGVPTELGDGISLPGPDVGIEVVAAPVDRVASNVVQDYAFYPNIENDTDLIVAPTPTGVEVMTSLRSAEAPHSTTYRMALPPEASLQPSPGGGAEVVQNGRKTVLVPPPDATDAAGNLVPAEMQVEGDEITVTVTPSDNAAYPILVDPTYIVEMWHWTLQHDSLAAWTPSTNNSSYRPVEYEYWNPTWYPGLDLTSGFPGPGTSGTHADWTYWVPRYTQDIANPKIGTPPTSWVYQMYTEGVLFHPNGNNANYPALVLGLTDVVHGWVVSGVHYGGQGEMDNWNNNFTFTNEHPTGSPNQTNTKGADMNLVTYEYEPQAKWRDTYIAYAAIAVADDDSPRILGLNPPSAWATGSYATIPYLFEDAGLGVRLAVVKPAGQSTPQWWTDFNCVGSTAAPCPRVAGSTEPGRPGLAYAPNQLPTGRNKLEVAVVDPIASAGHEIIGNVVVKVDNMAPEITLSGSLTEQGNLGTGLPAYALKIAAKDGSVSLPQSGIKRVQVKVDGNAVTMPDEGEWTPACQTENCPFSGEWGLNASDFPAGTHEVEVIATDAVGIAATKRLSFELHSPAPSLAVSGAITEQATLGLSRPRYGVKINASSLAESPIPAGTPSYTSAFGASGSGSGQFNHPGDVAIDSHGYLWVVDTANNRLQTFTPGGAYVATVGSSGSANGQLNRPTAIAIDASDNAWVVDSGNKRVQEFSNAGGFIRKFGSAGTGPGQFAGSGPEGIAIDYHGNVWVSDTYGARIEKFSATGEYLRAFGTRGLASGQLLEPTALEAGLGGNLWVTDWGRNRVLEFNSGGQFVREFGTEGSGDGEFRHPSGIAIDSKRAIWVGDQNNERVQEFNQGGEFIGKFGAPGSGSGQFNLGYPVGIVTDAAGNVWVTDTGNNRVQRWSVPGYTTPPGPSFLRAFGAPGVGNGQLTQPTGVAVDPKGSIWAVEYGGNRIQKFNEKGEYLLRVGATGTGNGQFSHPWMAASDANGNLWVTDSSNNRVQELSESGAFIRKFGTLGSGLGQLNEPTGIAVDSKNRVWVADAGNNRIQEFSEAGTFIRAVGSKGSGPAQMIRPVGVAATPDGNIWVADSGNNRLVEFSENGTFLRQVGTSGSGVHQFSAPTDISLDPSGRLWVVDQSNQRVQQLSSTGEFISQFGSPGAGEGAFSFPYAIDADSKGHLLVADWGNSRIEEWTRRGMYSQVSTEIAIDRKRVDANATSCEADTCPTQREWVLDSSAVAPGLHTVSVKATDGLGNYRTKSIEIEIEADGTKPALEVGGELASAPEGWVEQETYGIHASATDAGYGVTSLSFKIDGSIVESATQTCQQGACPASLSDNVDMSGYEGGAHDAEIVARDGAGNVTTKRWTINVDPEGHISTVEAEATLEALDETAEANTVGPAKEEEEYEGTALGLGLAPLDDPPAPETGEIATGFEAVNSSVPLVIGAQPGEGSEYHVLPEVALLVPCEESTKANRPGKGNQENPKNRKTRNPTAFRKLSSKNGRKNRKKRSRAGANFRASCQSR